MSKTDSSRYYFISYACRSKKSMQSDFGNALIDVHPLEWQVQQYKYDKAAYTLLFHKEITKADYDKYQGQFGN